MPWDVFCLSCGGHLAKASRYNAEKKHDGNYFSTKIWTFKFKCHLCSGEIVLKTDPENRDYACIVGCKRKTKEWDAEEVSGVKLLGEEEQDGIRSDPFKRLEHAQKDQNAARAKDPVLQQMINFSDSINKDTFALNYKLRKTLREEKKKKISLLEESESKGLGIKLLEPSNEDILQSTIELKNRTSSTYYQTLRKQKLKTESIFGNDNTQNQALKKLIKLGADIKNIRPLKDNKPKTISFKPKFSSVPKKIADM